MPYRLSRHPLQRKLEELPVERLIRLGEKRDRSVHTSDTATIISYHELSRIDCQRHSCYDG